MLYNIKKTLEEKKIELFDAINNKDPEHVHKILEDLTQLKKEGHITKKDMDSIINNKNDDSKNLLIHAFDVDAPLDILELLIKYGADVNLQCNEHSILAWSLIYSMSEDYIRYLLNKGANTRWISYDGLTCAMYAIQQTSYDSSIILQLLNDEIINKTDYYKKETVFLMASRISSYDIVKNILEHYKTKIDINQRNEFGNSALMLSIKGSNADKLEITRELITAGIDINLQNNDGDTALMLSIKGSDADKLEITRELITAGIDINLQNNNGDTALILSIKNQNKINENVIRQLINAGANKDLQNKGGFTVKHYIDRIYNSGIKHIIQNIVYPPIFIQNPGNEKIVLGTPVIY